MIYIIKSIFIITVFILFTSCGGNSSDPNESTVPPGNTSLIEYQITSPPENAILSGPVFFSIDLLDKENIQQTTFKANGVDIEPENSNNAQFKVFLLPDNYSEGELQLEVVVIDKSGNSSSKIRPVFISHTPTETGVLSEGAGTTLSTVEKNGHRSVLTVPKGSAIDGEISFKSKTKDEVKQATGVDYDAMGVTFLGAQEIITSGRLDKPIIVSSGGYGPMVQPGQAVANYMITQDMDGDGIGEIVVTNTATVAPNGDVISDPVSAIDASWYQTNNANLHSNLKSSSYSSTVIDGAPGTELKLKASGLNYYSAPANVVLFKSAVDGREVAVNGSLAKESDGLILTTHIPNLPAGATTVEIHNLTTNEKSQALPLIVKPFELGEINAAQVIDNYYSRYLDVVNVLETEIRNNPPDEKNDYYTLFFQYSDALKEHISVIKSSFQDLFQELSQYEDQENLKGIYTQFDNFAKTIIVSGALDGSEQKLLQKTVQEYDREKLTRRSRDEMSKALIDLIAIGIPDIAGEFMQSAGLLTDNSKLTNSGIILDALISALTIAKAIDATLGYAAREIIDALNNNETELPAPEPPPVPPGSTTNNMTTGMGAFMPSGGSGAGFAKTQSPSNGSSNARSLSQEYKRKGLAYSSESNNGPFSINLRDRIVVKVLVNGRFLPFRGISDQSGYFFIPAIPEGETFIAMATDTLTNEIRTFEGVGPELGNTASMFFDFMTDFQASKVEVIELDQIVSGEFQEGEEQKIYSFSVSPGTEVFFHSVSVDGEFSERKGERTSIISDSEGNVLLKKQIGGNYNYSPGRVVFEKGGTYTLVIGAVGSSGSFPTGKFTFIANKVVYENFNINIGDPIFENSPEPGAGYISRIGDGDIYHFTAEAGQEIFLEYFIEGATLPTNEVLRRFGYGSKSSPIVRDQEDKIIFSGGLSAVGPQVLETGGQYSITVVSDLPKPSSPSIGAYNLNIHPIIKQEFNIELGDKISKNSPFDGAGNIEESGHYDVYYFDAMENKEIEVNIDSNINTHHSSHRWAGLYVFDPGEEEVYSSLILGLSRPHDFTTNNAGRYKLVIGPHSGAYLAISGEYSFSINETVK